MAAAVSVGAVTGTSPGDSNDDHTRVDKPGCGLLVRIEHAVDPFERVRASSRAVLAPLFQPCAKTKTSVRPFSPAVPRTYGPSPRNSH
jgi:hypothetical protein